MSYNRKGALRFEVARGANKRPVPVQYRIGAGFYRKGRMMTRTVAPRAGPDVGNMEPVGIKLAPVAFSQAFHLAGRGCCRRWRFLQHAALFYQSLHQAVQRPGHGTAIPAPEGVSTASASVSRQDAPIRDFGRPSRPLYGRSVLRYRKAARQEVRVTGLVSRLNDGLRPAPARPAARPGHDTKPEAVETDINQWRVMRPFSATSWSPFSSAALQVRKTLPERWMEMICVIALEIPPRNSWGREVAGMASSTSMRR